MVEAYVLVYVLALVSIYVHHFCTISVLNITLIEFDLPNVWGLS